jgi:glycine hydroxymethyltransferase
MGKYTELVEMLKISLKQQEELSNKQLILNPVENVPDLEYIELGTSFLYGIYNSDKTRSNEQQINTKIQFANRDTIAYDINKIYESWCNILNAKAISMRFFSGLHAHTTIFMAITNINDSVIILPEKAGGHMATKSILERLGLNVYELQIDYNNKRIDVEKSKKLIEQVKPNVIFIDRSEGLIYEDFTWLSKYTEIYKIYDASQYLTNILACDYVSPFDMGFDAILSTTHKNFPGPQRALYCSKEKDVMWEKIYSNIGTYVSNMHPYSVYSLGLMLDKYEIYKTLSSNMLKNAELLRKELIHHKLNIVQQCELYPLETHTHHLWVLCSDRNEAFELYKRWEKYGFLTNYRLLPYNLGYGIRLGLSAATVCGLRENDIPKLASLLANSYHETEYNPSLHKEIEQFILDIKGVRNA